MRHNKTTTPEQYAYLERLRGRNFAALVSNDYNKVIIFLHEQYKGVKEAYAMLVAIADY